MLLPTDATWLLDGDLDESFDVGDRYVGDHSPGVTCERVAASPLLCFPIWEWDDCAIQTEEFLAQYRGPSPFPGSNAGSLDSLEVELARLLGGSRQGHAAFEEPQAEVSSILRDALAPSPSPDFGSSSAFGCLNNEHTSPTLGIRRRSPPSVGAVGGLRAESRTSVYSSETCASTVLTHGVVDGEGAAAAAASAAALDVASDVAAAESRDGATASGSHSWQPAPAGQDGPEGSLRPRILPRAEAISEESLASQTVFSDTDQTGSLFALGDGDDPGVQGTLDDSLRLDFGRLLSLGRSPVPFHLSSDEARCLPRVRFEAPERQNCSICLEHFSQGMLLTGLHCGHVFHVDCLSQWVQRSARCPICRASVEPCLDPCDDGGRGAPSPAL